VKERNRERVKQRMSERVKERKREYEILCLRKFLKNTFFSPEAKIDSQKS
jgi:hypothetical protein